MHKPSDRSQDAQPVSQTCREGRTEMALSLNHTGKDHKLVDMTHDLSMRCVDVMLA